ncbi:50S ribosomal protein L9 [Candidatus Aerophobetes bacterium]|nr:50S ribosomal protein L9 [Candidatus Aerophobetes bacterium]
MKVILKKEIPKLGKRDEIVKVSDGYARNFLFPKNLALKATPGNIKQKEEREKIFQRKREKDKYKALQIAEKLKDARVIIEREMGEEGKLFGVVTSQDIVREIERKFRVRIDHRKIELEEPIKTIGIQEISVKLHPQVKITLPVEVKKKKE